MAIYLGFINNLGFNEIALIIVLALLLFGPRRLPEMGRMMGRTMGQWRRGYYDLKRSFELEIEEADRAERRKGLREREQNRAPASSQYEEEAAGLSPPAADEVEEPARPLTVPRGASPESADGEPADEAAEVPPTTARAGDE
jgi:Tat protein translocase TatB subunit